MTSNSKNRQLILEATLLVGGVMVVFLNYTQI